jgi:hypothetical protein
MPHQHTIRDGETIAGLAFETGHWWRTIWRAPENEALREVRPDAQLLRAGDVVFVPDKTLRRVHGLRTGGKHSFRRKGVPSVVRVRLVGHRPAPLARPPRDRGLAPLPDPSAPPPRAPAPEPLAGVPFAAEVEGGVVRGVADGDGYVEVPVRPNAREVILTLWPDEDHAQTVTLDVGVLDPVSFVRGQKQRLRGLGWSLSVDDDEDDPAFIDALQAFQRAAGLPSATPADAATRSALIREFGA